MQHVLGAVGDSDSSDRGPSLKEHSGEWDDKA